MEEVEEEVEEKVEKEEEEEGGKEEFQKQEPAFQTALPVLRQQECGSKEEMEKG